jgi:hypothetical protein
MDIEPLIDALLIQKMSRRKSLGHLSEECLGVTSEIKSRGYSGISGCLLASRKPMQELPKAAIRSEGPSKKSNTATGYRCQLCRYKDKVVFQSLASSTFGLHGFLSNPKTPTTDKTRSEVEAMNSYLETAISSADTANQIIYCFLTSDSKQQLSVIL